MPENAQHLMNRADSYFEKRSYQIALDCYNLALGFTSDKQLLGVLYPKIAKTYVVLNQHKEAVNAYKEAMKYVSSQHATDIYVRIGRVHQAIENYVEAVQSYQKALNQPTKPEFEGDVLYWLGESLHNIPEKEKDNESLSVLDEAKSKPRNLVILWEIYNTKGYILTRKQRFEEALQEFELALNEEFDLIDIPGNLYNNKASCLEKVGKVQEAITCYQKAINHTRSKFDTKGYAHFKIGVLLKNSDLKSAVMHLEKAKEFFKRAKEIGYPIHIADEYVLRIRQYLEDIHQELRKVDTQDTLSLQHLQKRYEEFQQQYTLQSEKITRLRRACVLENDVSTRFKYEKQLQEIEHERDKIEQEMRNLEKIISNQSA